MSVSEVKSVLRRMRTSRVGQYISPTLHNAIVSVTENAHLTAGVLRTLRMPAGSF
jgi:hypothetical protein